MAKNLARHPRASSTTSRSRSATTWTRTSPVSTGQIAAEDLTATTSTSSQDAAEKARGRHRRRPRRRRRRHRQERRARRSSAVKLDREALARYDLDLGDVQDYIETAMGGHVASELWEGERRFDVTVRLPPGHARGRRRHPRACMLPLKDGSLIPLSALADVRMGTGRAAITRENGRRYVGVRMNVRNRDLGSFVAEAQRQGRKAAIDAARRLRDDLGRRVREPAARHGAPPPGDPAGAADHVPPALLGVRLVFDAAIILLNVPVRAHRRRLRPRRRRT